MDKTDARSVVVEAESWQRALQAARTARGEKGPISGFSIELLDEGYRAVDPLARLRFDVKRAAPDAPLTDLTRLGGASAPPPPVAPVAHTEMGEAISADATIAAPTVTTSSSAPPPPPPKKKSAPPPPPPKAAAKKTSSGKMKAAPVAAPTPTVAAPAPILAFAPSKTDGQNHVTAHPGASHAGANGNADATIRTDAVRFDAPPRFEPPPAAAAASLPSEPSLPVPATQVIFKREHDPTERLPLTYREYVFTVARGVDEAAGERLLRTQLGLVRASIAGARPGKFVNLAVFDTIFQGRPPVPPLATLAWKDWRGEPQVVFPRRGPTASATPSTRPPPPSNRPPAPSVAPQAPAAALPPAPPIAAAPPVAPPPATPASIAPPAPVPQMAQPPALAPASIPAPASFPPPVAHAVAAAPSGSAPPSALRAPDINPFAAPLAPAAADPFAAGVAPLPPGVPVPAFDAPSLSPQAPLAPAGPAPVQSAPPPPAPALQAPPGFVPPAAAPSFAPPPPPAFVPVGQTVSAAAPASVVPPPAPASVAPPPAPPLAPVAVADPFAAPGQPAQAAAPAAAPVAAGGAFPAPVAHGHSSATGQHRAAGRLTPTPSRPSLRSLSGGRRPSGDELIASLFEAMHELNFARDVIEGGDYVLSLALDMIPSRAGIVHLYDIDRREYVVACAAGPGTEGLLNRRHLEGEPLLANAMRKRRALVFTDSRTEESVVGSERFAVLGGATSVIVSPVMKGGRFIGVIELLNPLDGIGFTDEEGNAIDYLAEQFGEFVASKGMQLDADRITRSVPPPG